MGKAGELFRCGCCGDAKPEVEACWDEELQSVVCKECRKDMIKVTAWLRHEKIVGYVNDSIENRPLKK